MGRSGLWVLYNRSMKPWLHDNDIEIYSTHNEGKSVVAERIVRTLKSKIYKYITVASKILCINKLDGTVDKYNKTYHRTIKIKLAGVNLGVCIDDGVGHNDKDPKFKVGD